ncbi:RagB/SusD family nutrient uptake outer membrane protein [Mariniphaga sediminis]|uniref:RagB/SusD family nutrient uptake outer membrane protein n=1 Tax=Mariniphaga sediminis TaxID=1628158 RepID=A0A399DA55_9BACT|nr:RagB/SusD family nutrient uptake outer membrane protein [Mariniphaga sediminis]RIH67102.1 RagB/SusD family nutrient uptake outer membrane protein [Mariniphaga sediminis]
MKNFKNHILILLSFLLLFYSCEEQILDKKPLDRYSDAVVWADIKLADRYLKSLYYKLYIGWKCENIVTQITDDTHNRVLRGTDVYLQGRVTPSDLGPISNRYGYIFLRWDVLFSNIQDINVFLDNIDKVPENYEGIKKNEIEEKVNVLKGEAFFLRAFCYTNLVRIYGGVPLFDKPNKQDDDLLSYTRASFEETIQFISDDCDAAAALLLSNSQTVMGNASKGAALALKSRIWLFAASDLTADGNAANKYVGYENPNRNELWTKAKNAAKAVIDLGEYSLDNFGAPNKASVSENYYQFFRQKDLSSEEIIFGRMYSIPEYYHKINVLNGPNGTLNWGVTGVTQELVDVYQMNDGSDFSNHFTLDENDFYKNASSKYTSQNPYHNRDPRFTGTILYDSAVWQPRFSDLAERDPLGIYERRTRIKIVNGEEVSRVPGIDTHEGPVYPSEATYTGYCMRKFLDDEVQGAYEGCEQIWVEIRYPEILLNYAEACLELGENNEAEHYINMVRNRAAMPDFTNDIKEALKYERRVEMALEEGRFYDIRRWKILEDVFNSHAHGIKIEEINDDGVITTTWQRILVQERGPVVQSMYWFPIPTVERNKAPQLEQNPSY